MDPVAQRRIDRCFAVLVVGLGLIIFAMGRNGWFMYDDWQWLGSRRDLLTDGGLAPFLLEPHNGHLMAGPLLWHLGVTSAFGLESYAPSMVTIAAANVAVVVVVRQVLLFVGVRRVPASCTAPLLLVWAPAAGCLFWGPETVFAVVVAMFLGHLLLVSHDGPADWRDRSGSALGLASVLSHTLGVIGLVSIVAMLGFRRRTRAAFVAALPLIVYATWYVVYGDQSVSEVPSWTRQLSTFSSMWSTAVRDLAPSTIGLALVVSCVVGVLWWDAASHRHLRRSVLLTLLGAAALFALAVARSRQFGQLDISSSDRYVYVMLVLLMPFLVLALQGVTDALRSHQGPAVSTIVAVALLSAVWLTNITRLSSERNDLQVSMGIARADVDRVLTGPGVDQLPTTTPVADGFLSPTVDLTVGHVRRLQDDGLLPDVGSTTDVRTRGPEQPHPLFGQDLGRDRRVSG
jgi:hypothetical protein